LSGLVSTKETNPLFFCTYIYASTLLYSPGYPKLFTPYPFYGTYTTFSDARGDGREEVLQLGVGFFNESLSKSFCILPVFYPLVLLD
ncbi:MAG: hypothetical protein LUF85_15070, partial [Bacteroides sp.]|nr:hypothetical protein [Bacteroides sp.]